MASSGGHMHGAADLKPDAANGYVLRDDGTWSQVAAAGLASSAVTTAKIDALAVTTATIAANAVTSAKLDPTTIQYATTTLTAQQVKALRATPVTVVPAPGAGYVVEFLSAFFFLNYGSEVFTETADNFGLFYASEAVAVSTAIETTNFLDQAGDVMLEVRATSAAVHTKAEVDGKALTLKNSGDGEIGGNASNDSTLRVNVSYRVHPNGW